MLSPARSLPYPGPSGLSLPTLLRWVPTLLLAMLLTATLTACGGDSGGATEQPPYEEGAADTSTGSAPAVSTPAEDTPTPEAQTQDGAELTTREYAEALEEFFWDRDDGVEDAYERFFVRNRFSAEESERISSLETAESWSEEDAEFASKYAETALRASVGLFDVVLGFQIVPEEFTSLRPPEHLSDLHDNFIATLGDFTRLSQQQLGQRLDEVKEANTDIRNREDLAEFSTLVNSLEAGGWLDPGAQELFEQAEEGCLALKDQLEAELERDVNICE